MTHTPIPWEAHVEDFIGDVWREWIITDADKRLITTGTFQEVEDQASKANAQFIVTAVNNHQALLEALEWALPRVNCAHLTPAQTQIYREARATIARVTEES